MKLFIILWTAVFIISMHPRYFSTLFLTVLHTYTTIRSGIPQYLPSYA
jgi:hypothetical protein